MTYQSRHGQRGFTLIELLVVVAIIALLISILLPSLSSARKQARAVKCGANLRSVGQAFASYLAGNNAVYPPSYIYPKGPGGDYDLSAQVAVASHPHGYLHWSYFLFSNGCVDWNAFTCPEFPNMGAPRTNPGRNSDYWMHGEQHDQNHVTAPDGASVEDKQAPWMAYTANAAVVTRNKFQMNMVPGQVRTNRLVREGQLVKDGGVILATELHTNWRFSAIDDGGGGTYLCKAHRPVSAFVHVAVGTQEHAAPTTSAGFRYGIHGQEDYGLTPSSSFNDSQVGIIDGATGGPEVDAVGRHHPGGDHLGGTTNFLYTDGHVARKTILETMKSREWGSKYHSLNGPNTEVKFEHE